MNRRIVISLIVENNTPDHLIPEHGFAAWIEIGDICVLFDTGQGLALEHNAFKLGIDFSQASALILSHGHYDHTGGIPAFLTANSFAPVFYGKGATISRLSCPPNQPPKPVGIIDEVMLVLDQLARERRIELDTPYYLVPGVGITGPIPRLTPFEDTGGPFFLDAEKKRPDPIVDDLSMWFETTRGLVILTGCCHSGLVNTINYIREISGIQRICGIIGGMHLLNASNTRLDQTLQFIADCSPDFLIPCHCTGAHVVERLQYKFGEKIVTPGIAGQRINAGSLAGEQSDSQMSSRRDAMLHS